MESMINDTITGKWVTEREREREEERCGTDVGRFRGEGVRERDDTLGGHLNVYPPTTALWVNESFSRHHKCCNDYRFLEEKHSYFLIWYISHGVGYFFFAKIYFKTKLLYLVFICKAIYQALRRARLAFTNNPPRDKSSQTLITCVVVQ